ncbi:MAG: hypothetical protein MR324_11180 [Lachnospiraceae bacterium]|nr:hypothetical protein [Lachnospiraceae bacterium]
MQNNLNYEIIDRLCSVTEKLSEIVKKQAEVIDQSKIASEVQEELEKMRSDADRELNTLGNKMRKGKCQ